MPDYSTEIAALEAAIASGTKLVSYDGRTVQYSDFNELLARRRFLLDLQSGAPAGRPSTVASFSRGDE